MWAQELLSTNKMNSKAKGDEVIWAIFIRGRKEMKIN